MTLRGPGKTNAPPYRSQLKLLGEEVDKAEADVSARSAEFRAQSRPITIEAVQSAIPERAALVEFALYHSGVTGMPTGAGALCGLSTECTGPTSMGRLWARPPELTARWTAWRRALTRSATLGCPRLARAVDEKIMHPVRLLLGRSEHLLISSDGPLNLIPFAALVDEHNSYLVDRYTITYLTSGRDLLRLQVPRASKSAPVVVADPAFGEPATVASG